MYTTIIHPLRKALKLTLTEYCVLESIRSLSHNNEYGCWCVASKQTIADGLDITRQQIHTIINKLVERGFIEKGERGALRTVDDYNRLFDIDDLRISDFDSLISLIPNKFTHSKEILPNSNVNELDIYDTHSKETLQSNVKKLDNDSKETLHYTNNNTNNNTLKKDIKKKKSIEGFQSKKYPENTEEYFGIYSEQKPKRKTKLELSKEFYDNELKSGFEGFSAEVAKLYPGFVKFLYGRNSFDDPLTGVLGLEKQVSKKNFDELLKLSRQHNKKISDSVEAIENSKNGKYYKGRKSLYLILRKWLSNTNFDK